MPQGLQSPLRGIRSPFGAQAGSRARRFAKGKANVISWAFDDPVSDMGSVWIADTATPANNFNSSASAAILAKFTGWSATSPMTVRGRDGTLKYAPHNLCRESETLATSPWTSEILGDGVTPTVTGAYESATAGGNTISLTRIQCSRTTLSPSHRSRRSMLSLSNLVSGLSYELVFWARLTSGAGPTSIDVAAPGLSATQQVSLTDTLQQFSIPYTAASSTSDGIKLGLFSASTGAAVDFVAGAVELKQTPVHSGYVKTTSAAVYQIPTTYDTSGNKLGFLDWEARTNAAWWSRDLTQSAHIKTNVNAYKYARGTDGELNSASRFVTTAANGNVIQRITATSAQRVSSMKVRRASGGGTVKMSQGETTGSELVSNGTFDTVTTGWTAFNDAVLSVASARLRITNNVTDYGSAYQTLTTVAGKLYKITFEVVVGTGTAWRLNVGTTVGASNLVTVTSSGAGTFTYYFLATSTASTVQLVHNTTNDTSYIDFDNISVLECTDTTLSLNAVSYSEVSGTELVTNGGLGADTNWTKDLGVTISGGVANFNVTGYSGMSQSISAAVARLYRVDYTITVVSGAVAVGFGVSGENVGPVRSASGTYTEHVFLPVLSNTDVYFRGNGAGGAFVGTVDNISVKEVEPSQAWTEAETAAATITNPCVAIWCSDNVNAIDVDHVQCEVGAKASPPIITAGAAVTRAASLLTIDTSLFNWSGSAGTSVLHFTSAIPPGAASYNVLTLGSSNFCYVTNNATHIRAFDGTTGLGGSSFPIAQNVKQKVAYAFGARGQNLTVNGAAVINAAFDGTFGNGTNLRIENASAGFIVSRFKIVRDEASDAELIAETA